MPERYIGTKIILAEPMDEFTFQRTVKGVVTPADSFAPAPRDGYKVMYEDGYVSWSPKDTFEKAYRKISNNELNLIENPDLMFAVQH